MKPTPAILGIFGFLCLGLSAYGQCEPFFGDLVINEVMPANSSTATDPAGEYDDWVELYNGSDDDINMEGYFLSDNNGNKTKYVFPDVTIMSNSTLIIWCDNQIEQEGLHAPFNLSANGEEVGLYNTDTLSLDFVRFGATSNVVTIGRYPNGVGPFSTLLPTFDQLNTLSANTGLVLNEFQADNESTVQDQWGGYDDWIELYNNSDQPINLEGYYLSDKIGDPTQFEFPDTTLLAHEYLIIWCDQGLMEPGLHTFFKLGNTGDDILLSNPDTLTIDYLRYALQIPDDSEGRFSNGIGEISCMIPTHGVSNGEVDGIFEVQERQPLEVWPNPATDAIWISNDNPEDVELSIFDLRGKMMIQTILRTGNQQIDLSGLSAGMYLLITDEKQAKIMVE